jgi:glycosyltransferase involved in cell wall biosynthesis
VPEKNPAVVSAFVIDPFRIGSNEAFARELSRQLGEHGWRSVLCFVAEPPAQVREYLALPNVTLEVLPSFGRLCRAGLAEFSRILRKYHPAILHLHFTSFLGPYPWLAKLHSVRHVFFTDQYSRPAGYVPRRAPWWKRLAVRLINWPLDRVICVSEYGRRCCTGLGTLPRRRFTVIYNSVALERAQSPCDTPSAFREKHGIPANRAIVLQVSWMIPQKGIPDLLHAARLVLEQNREVQFVLAGDGVYRGEYMRLAGEMGIADHVTWTGIVRDPFGEGLFAAADVVCQVSRWEEVFGWVIAEAMAFSRPLVATRVGGIPELVQDGKSGFLVDRGDVEDIARRILQLLGDAALRRRMGESGRRITEEKFDLRQNVARLVHLYGLPAPTPCSLD